MRRRRRPRRAPPARPPGRSSRFGVAASAATPRSRRCCGACRSPRRRVRPSRRATAAIRRAANGLSASASPRPRGPITRGLLDRCEQARRGAVEVALRDLVAVDAHLQEHDLRVDLVGGHDARADRDRHTVGGDHRRAARVAGLPIAHQRVAEQVPVAAERIVGRGLQPEHGRDLRLVFQPGGAGRPRHVLLGADQPALDVERAGRQERGGEQRRQDPAGVSPSSRRRRRAPARFAPHPRRCLGCSRRDPRAWWERPDARRRRADRPPHPRGSPPVAAAPRGRR